MKKTLLYHVREGLPIICLCCALASLLFVLSLLFGACGHDDFYYNEDEAPVLTVFKSSYSVSSLSDNLLTDTVKVGAELRYRYACSDVETLEPEVSFDVVPASCSCSVNGNELVFICKQPGIWEGNIVCYDIYKKPSVLNFKISSFENQAPTPKLKLSKVSTLDQFDVLIDMRDSFDGDAVIGGKVSMYEYIVTSSDGNVFSVQTELPYMNYIFKGSGLQKVQGRVCDNDGVWSDWVTEYIEI